MHDGTPDDPEFDAFASSLDDMLERVSSTTRVEQEAREKEWQAPAKRAPHSYVASKATPAPAPTPNPTTAALGPLAVSAVNAKPRDRGRLAWGVVALVAIGAVFAWIGQRFDASPAPTLEFEQLPAPAAGLVRPQDSSPEQAAASSTYEDKVGATPLPTIASDPDASTETVMLQELRHGSAANASSETPSFAISRYDSLPPHITRLERARAARGGRGLRAGAGHVAPARTRRPARTSHQRRRTCQPAREVCRGALPRVVRAAPAARAAALDVERIGLACAAAWGGSRRHAAVRRPTFVVARHIAGRDTAAVEAAALQPDSLERGARAAVLPCDQRHAHARHRACAGADAGGGHVPGRFARGRQRRPSSCAACASDCRRCGLPVIRSGRTSTRQRCCRCGFRVHRMSLRPYKPAPRPAVHRPLLEETCHETIAFSLRHTDAGRRSIFAVRPGNRCAGGRRSTGGRARHRPLRVQPHDGVACRPAIAARRGRDDEGRDVAHCLGRRLRRQRGGRPLQQAAVGPARQGGACLPTRQGDSIRRWCRHRERGPSIRWPTTPTAEGRAQNRRTEVTFTGVRTIASSH